MVELTITRSADNSIRGVRRLRVASFVDGNNPELVLLTLCEVRHSTSCVWPNPACSLPIGRALLLLLHNVSCDWSTSVALRRGPLEVNMVTIPINNFWTSGL